MFFDLQQFYTEGCPRGHDFLSIDHVCRNALYIYLLIREQFIICVRGPSMIGRQSLKTRMPILSGPGDLLLGIAMIIR